MKPKQNGFLLNILIAISIQTRGLIPVLFLFYKRGEGDVTKDGGSTNGHNTERDSRNEN